MTEMDKWNTAFENDHSYLKTTNKCKDDIQILQTKISTVDSTYNMSVPSQTPSTNKNQETLSRTSKNEAFKEVINVTDSNVFFLPGPLNFPLPTNVKVSQNNFLVQKIGHTSSMRPIQPKPTTSKIVPTTLTQSNKLLIPSIDISQNTKSQDATAKKSSVKSKLIVTSQSYITTPIKPIKNKIVKDYENGMCTIKLSSNLYKRIQSGEKLFMCMECDKIYTEHKDLLDHQMIHDKCDTKIINEENGKKEKLLVSNVKDQRVQQTKPNFRSKKRKLIFQGECIMCHLVFPDLGKHLRTVHQSDFKKKKLNHLKYHCPKCNMKFDHQQQLKAHELSAHKLSDIHTCEYCFKDFNLKGELEEHIETHFNENMKYLCPYCDSGFSNSKGLKTHLVKHIGFNSSENSTSEVQDNQIEYSPTKPAEQLNHSFEDLNNISDDVHEVYVEKVTDDNYRVRFTNDHEDNENISSPLEDSLMDEDDQINIKLNKESIDNNKIPSNQLETSSLCRKRISYTVCRLCMIIVSYSRIGKHMKKKHNNAAPYQCEICHAEFNRKHIMDDHRRKHTNDKPHKCVECSKCFTYKHHLNRHMMIVHSADTLEKQFKCSVCDKAFSFKEYLTLHINSRHKGKHYMCQVCGKSFSTNAALNKHQLCHTDERPFMCEQCGRTFKCKIHYETHTKNMHPGDPLLVLPAEKFECNLCNKKFSTKIYRDMHFKRHNGQGHQCDICYKIFVSKAHMQRHIKIMHRN